MRSLVIKLVLVLGVSSQCFATPLTVEQAKAISESHFNLAFHKAYKLIFSCLTNPSECGTTQTESFLLNKIYYELLSLTARQLEFVSELDEPGFFQIDGATRIAKTGLFQGSRIYINKDMLVITDPTDPTNLRPISFEEALGILVHELGHHNESALSTPINHEQLDIMALKIRAEMMRYARVETFNLNDQSGNSTEVTIGHYTSVGSANQNQEESILIVTGAFGLRDLSGIVEDRITCPRSYYRDELDFEGYPFAMALRDFDISLLNSTTIHFDIRDAAVLCMNTLRPEYDVFPRYRDGVLDIPLKSDANGVWDIDMLNLNFQMTTPPDQHWN